MNLEPLIEELVGLLKGHGVKVRREPIEESRGGLCTVAGSPVLFIDSKADPLQTAEICAQALCRVVDVTKMYLRPNIREFIESAVGCGDGRPPAL